MGLGPWQEAQAESSSGDGRRQGMGGSVVEFSPATREARVRFPAHAESSPFWSSRPHCPWTACAVHHTSSTYTDTLHWATAHTLWPVSLASPHSDNYLEPPSNHLTHSAYPLASTNKKLHTQPTHSPPPTRNYTLSLPTRLHQPLMLSLLHLLLQGVIYLFSGGTLSLSLDTPEDTTYTRFIRFHYTWLGATMCLLAIKLRTSVRAIGALTH